MLQELCIGHKALFYNQVLNKRLVLHNSEKPQLLPWLISNEIPIYGGEGDERVINSWALLMINAVRAGGGTQPVSLGDGQWGVETTGHDSGFCSLEYGPPVPSRRRSALNSPGPSSRRTCSPAT